MTTPVTLFIIAALVGGILSVLAQAGTKDQSRMADLFATLISGCLFGTFALFLGARVLWVEALLGIGWVLWVHLQRRVARSRRMD